MCTHEPTVRQVAKAPECEDGAELMLRPSSHPKWQTHANNTLSVKRTEDMETGARVGLVAKGAAHRDGLVGWRWLTCIPGSAHVWPCRRGGSPRALVGGVARQDPV